VWTPARVRDALVCEFNRVGAAPRAEILLAADAVQYRAQTPSLIAYSSRYLGRQSHARMCLLIWARCKATGESMRQHCCERGWSRSSFYRSRRSALEVMAINLNRECVVVSDSLSNVTNLAAGAMPRDTGL
jgi:hypothetical protein